MVLGHLIHVPDLRLFISKVRWPMQIRRSRACRFKSPSDTNPLGMAVRVIRRKTNRRHMTGDHHGQAAGMASLLVRAVDGILGTHKVIRFS